MMPRLISVLGVACAVLGCAPEKPVARDPAPIEARELPTLKEIEARRIWDRKELAGVVSEHLANRSELVRALCDVVDDEKADNRARATAARALGKIRAPEAAEVLTRRIAFYEIHGYGSISLWGHHPCLSSLVSIGKPATKVVLARLKELPAAGGVADPMPRVRQQREFLAVALLKAEGADAAARLLDEAVGAENSTSARHNLEGAKKLLEKVKGW